VHKNVGTVYAVIRISLGLTGLVWSAARLANAPGHTKAQMIALLSGFSVAEGITRFCLLSYIMGINTRRLPSD
jgi:hypothetical protein